jgi:glycosyltransferase involved in cell wall biosynthesis
MSNEFHTKNTPSVSVVIPALNEAKNLPFVLPRIPKWVDEIILVDGGSEDETVQVARELLPDIRIVYQTDCCKGAALRQGFDAATGDIIVMLDADGSTDPSEMGTFVRYLRNGADFVKGSRFLQGSGSADISTIRQWGNWGLTVLVRSLFGGSFSDLCYGYIAFWKRFLPVLHVDADGFEIETLMSVRALKARLNVVEVHSFEAKRLHGESHLRALPDGFRVLRTIVRERIAPLENLQTCGKCKNLAVCACQRSEMELGYLIKSPVEVRIHDES